MHVKIIRVADHHSVEAIITRPQFSLPSLTDGWRFNFRKHARKRGYNTFVLVCAETTRRIKGCLIFQLREAVEPYMAYIEIAPHNKGAGKIYDRVAGCLIAYASRLSFIHGKDHFKGWLAFDVLEENTEHELRLMALYSKKYGALRWGRSAMVISPEAGEKLMNEYLT